MTAGRSRVLISAGEASGDLYGGLLMRAMADGPGGPPGFVGIGGPSMRAAGIEGLGDASSMGVTGFLEVVGQLGVIWKAFGDARRLLRDPASRPDLAVLIDYPDFNLRLASAARKAGVPVLYFVSPQVWAWRKGRVRQIARFVDRMLVILPFEEEFYRAAGVPVQFVGHPLLDLVRRSLTREQALGPLGLDPKRRTVALLPGSRRNELASHLPPMLGAARLLREEFRDIQFLVPIAPTLDADEVDRLIGQSLPARGPARGPARADGPGVGWALVRDGRYDAVGAADAAVVASGTATLETALLGVPMVIVYRMNPFTHAIARLISDIPHIGMPNLIAGDRIVPELVQGECRPDRIAGEIRRILTEPPAAEAMRKGLAAVRGRLGAPGAIGRVAGVAWDMIGPRSGR